MTKKTLSVRVSQEVYDNLAEIAEASGKRLSDVARDILENSFKGKAPLSQDELETFLKLSVKLNSALKNEEKRDLLIRLGEALIDSIKRDEQGIPVRNETNNSLGFIKVFKRWELAEEYLRRFENEY